VILASQFLKLSVKALIFSSKLFGASILLIAFFAAIQDSWIVSHIFFILPHTFLTFFCTAQSQFLPISKTLFQSESAFSNTSSSSNSAINCFCLSASVFSFFDSSMK